MFGHNDNQQQSGNDQPADSVLNAAMPDPIAGNSDANAQVDTNGPTFPSGAPSMPSNTFSPTAPGTMPMSTGMPNSNDQAPSEVPSNDLPDVSSQSSTPGGDDVASDPGDLMGLKQQALQHLSPLVSHLDQTPEEKFRTTMMMIQASDDQSLLTSAFESAKAIPDDKARAQALLDVINEINYFTQHK
jgi:hypothetical protein